MEDFHNVEGAENGIQDALILLYGGSVTLSMRNIQVLSRFATIYKIKELLSLCMEWIRNNLGVENVMIFFKALQTVDRSGEIEIPDIIRKFMEEKTGAIVDHLLSSSDSIDDDFLLAMLELPSSSILVQRCLKAGMLPDPIVELIFKHSNTINVNFLLHDDKRTYVRLITILKSKARSYKDMEKIIDIQQKCISKMCHPYGSVDSLAASTMVGMTPAPSIATMAPPTSRGAAFQPVERPRREEYHPKSLERERERDIERDRDRERIMDRERENGHRHQNDPSDNEYLMPEELKHNKDRFMRDFNKDRQDTPPWEKEPEAPPPETRHQSSIRGNGRPAFGLHDSSQESDLKPDFSVFNHDRNRDDPVEKSFTSQRNRDDDRMPPSVVAQLKQNLAKNFVAKFPDQNLPSTRPKHATNYDDNKDEGISDAETYLEDNRRSKSTSRDTSGMKSLSLGRSNRDRNRAIEPSEDNRRSEEKHKTNYAQVYMKKNQLKLQRDNNKFDDKMAEMQEQTQHITTQQDEMMEALNRLAEQQAIIEHTYDNMSILSGRVGRMSPLREGGNSESHQVQVHVQAPSERERTSSSASKRSVLAADSLSLEKESGTATLRAPIHIPTTFGTTGSARSSQRSNRPPDLPSNPPPGSTSFFAGGAPEAKSAQVERPPASQTERPPPTLCVPPPPKIIEPAPINLEAISSIDSGLPPDFGGEIPADCLPDHDRMTSPPPSIHPPNSIRSPPPASIASMRSRPFSPPIVEEEEEPSMERGRARAPQWQQPKIPIVNLKTRPPDLTKEELIKHSAILINKNRSRSKSKERTKSKERKSMRKKKGERAQGITIPISSIDRGKR